MNDPGLRSAERPAAGADVSACIVAWNARSELEACLDALPAAAGDLDLQVVVVDNGSRDGTDALLARREREEVIVNERNRGLTMGRNQALRQVRGRTVVMLDADTVPGTGSLETMVRYLDDHPEVGLLGPKLLNPDGSVQLSCRRMPPPLLPFLRRPPLDRLFERSRPIDRHLMRDFDHGRARAVDWVLGACQCYRAELIPLLGDYDERIFSHGGEDRDWCVRVWKAGY